MSSLKGYASVRIWPRAEPFTYGIFQVHPHPRLAVHNIKKLVSYAKNKNRGCPSRISYSVWKHVACNKLQLTEDLAWVLFQSCLSISSTNLDKLKEYDERIFNAPSLPEAEKIRASLFTDLYTFVLFLYIQQINKISLRASAVSANAEWPGSSNRSCELDSGRSTPIRPCRNLDEQFHVQFISENLSELLDLMAEPMPNYGSGNVDSILPEEAVEALNLILEGTVDQGRSLNSFSELVYMPVLLPATGYSKVSRTFYVRCLHSCIRSWLNPNPFSVENCIRNGRRLQWRLPHQVFLDKVDTVYQQQNQDCIKRQKIATNAHQVPRTGGRSGNKLVIMSMISRQIIARSSATLDGATLKIHRAHSSYLYLLSPMRCVTLDKCRKLTIVLGPIENTILLNQCEDCLVIVACRRAILAACRRCTLHFAIQSRPIFIQPSLPNAASGNVVNNQTGVTTSCSISATTISGNSSPGLAAAVFLGNEEILLAPFHTTYMHFVDHLNRVNLSPKVNYWNKPFMLGQDSSRHDQVQNSLQTGGGRCWDLLRPAHFYPFNIPLLLPNRPDNLDPKQNGSTVNTPHATSHCLDLSAALVTDTVKHFVESGNCNIEQYISIVNNKLPIPIPTAYAMALHERATLYLKWPQHIANARLTAEERQLFGTVVDQRFRKWLFESSNVRQLQLLEFTTSRRVNTPQMCSTVKNTTAQFNANNNYINGNSNTDTHEGVDDGHIQNVVPISYHGMTLETTSSNHHQTRDIDDVTKPSVLSVFHSNASANELFNSSC